jgi:hypothetical protein
MSATRLLGPFFWDRNFTPIYYTQSDTIFWAPVSIQQNLFLFPPQQSSSTHCTQIYPALKSVFGDRIISKGLWPSHSPDLHMYDFHLCGMLRNKVYSNINQNADNLKNHIEHAVSSITSVQLWCATNNVSVRFYACFQAKSKHFQHLV